MASFTLDKVVKTYDRDHTALHELNLTIADGEFMVLVGPSGCGKSTLLRLLAGLEDPTAGSIRMDGKAIDHWPPQRRNIAMVFQNYALYPHLTVRRNLEFPLRMRRTPGRERNRRVHHVAEMLGLTPLLDKQPGQLSGGERQRVAMGRAVIREPSAFLMDEPLSNLDAALRARVRVEIAALQRRLKVTTLYVTHDQTEALTLGHRVGILKQGRLQQVDAPAGIYDTPANAFVARFFGNPGMNLLRVRGLMAHGDDLDLDLGDRHWRLPRSKFAVLESLDRPSLGVRPEAWRLWTETAPTPSPLRVRIRDVETLGHEQLAHTDLPQAEGTPGASGEDTATLVLRLPARPGARPDEILEVTADPSDIHIFDAAGEAVCRPTTRPPAPAATLSGSHGL